MQNEIEKNAIFGLMGFGLMGFGPMGFGLMGFGLMGFGLMGSNHFFAAEATVPDGSSSFLVCDLF